VLDLPQEVVLQGHQEALVLVVLEVVEEDNFQIIF